MMRSANGWMPLPNRRITPCQKGNQPSPLNIEHASYDGHTTEIALQFIPVVTIINAEYLVLGHAQLRVGFIRELTHLDTEKVFHSLKDGDDSALNHCDNIWCCVVDV